MPSERSGDETTRTDGGLTAEQALKANGVGIKRESPDSGYGGNEEAREAIEEFLDDYLGEERIITSRSIANALAMDIRPQEIGKTLGAHIAGYTPDSWFDNVEISKWSDASPVKWRFERVDGDTTQKSPIQRTRVQLLKAITHATDADGVRFERVSRDGVSWKKGYTTIAWKHDVIDAICAAADYTPTDVTDGEFDTREAWVQELTQEGCTQVLERVLDIETEGVHDNWNRPTLRVVHDVLVSGHDPSEVSR